MFGNLLMAEKKELGKKFPSQWPVCFTCAKFTPTFLVHSSGGRCFVLANNEILHFNPGDGTR